MSGGGGIAFLKPKTRQRKIGNLLHFTETLKCKNLCLNIYIFSLNWKWMLHCYVLEVAWISKAVMGDFVFPWKYRQTDRQTAFSKKFRTKTHLSILFYLPMFSWLPWPQATGHRPHHQSPIILKQNRLEVQKAQQWSIIKKINDKNGEKKKPKIWIWSNGVFWSVF